jgi:hypothetical protein
MLSVQFVQKVCSAYATTQPRGNFLLVFLPQFLHVYPEKSCSLP